MISDNLETDGNRPILSDNTTHEIPILGDFNTISNGFAGGGTTKSARKRYARSIMMTTTIRSPQPTSVVIFLDEDMIDVVPHEDGPIVLFVVMMGKNIHRVLIDQGSFTDVMF